MSRHTVEPTIKESNGIHDSVMTHPAFAQITVCRTQGQTVLYGSDFTHQHFITLKIGPSELNRSLSRDWPYGSLNKYIEVEMSEAQFASMICNMNVGEGEQCTLTRLNGEAIPGIPAPIRRIEQYKVEADETVAKAQAALNELEEALFASGLSAKKLDALKWKVEAARRAVGGSMNYIAKSFGEHMEKVTERAKIEVSAFMTNAKQRAGLEVLNSQEPLIIEQTTKESNDGQ